MSELRELGGGDIAACAALYCRAFAGQPWNEEFDEAEVAQYLTWYVDNPPLYGYVLMDGGRAAGLALGILLPAIGYTYMKIEEFCIAPEAQQQGLGGAMLDMLAQRASALGADTLMLETHGGYPAHRFYLKNGFREIKSAVMLCRAADVKPTER